MFMCACSSSIHLLQHSVSAIFMHVHVHGALSSGGLSHGYHVLFAGRRHGDMTVILSVKDPNVMLA